MGRMFADFEPYDVQAKRREFEVRGKDIHLIQQICRKLSRGQDVARIADDLMEDLEVVSKICEAAYEFAPDYDAEAIYQKLHEEKAAAVTA